MKLTKRTKLYLSIIPIFIVYVALLIVVGKVFGEIAILVGGVIAAILATIVVFKVLPDSYFN